MRSDQSMALVLAFMQSQADADRIVRGISQEELGKQAGMPGRGAGYALELLIKAGAIVLLTKGKGSKKSTYQLGVPASEPVREYEPSGIESVVRHISNRNWLGASDSIPTIEISVARVRFLEGTRI